MSQDDWKAVIAKLPPGLTYGQAAEKLSQSYPTTRKWMLRFGYRAHDGRQDCRSRRKAMLAEYSGVDWTKSNIAIALASGKTRERIRQVRDLYQMEKVESRGRKKAA